MIHHDIFLSVDRLPPAVPIEVLDEWAYEHGVSLDFIQPGKPIQNPYVESFNGKMRDECLNVHWLTDLDEARSMIEEWRKDYTQVRPHSSLGNRTPSEFAQGSAEGQLPRARR